MLCKIFLLVGSLTQLMLDLIVKLICCWLVLFHSKSLRFFALLAPSYWNLFVWLFSCMRHFTIKFPGHRFGMRNVHFLLLHDLENPTLSPFKIWIENFVVLLSIEVEDSTFCFLLSVVHSY